MDNLEKIDRFLEKFNLPRLNKEEIEITNNSIASTEIEAVIKNLPKNKAQDHMASKENSINHFSPVQFSRSVVSDSFVSVLGRLGQLHVKE